MESFFYFYKAAHDRARAKQKSGYHGRQLHRGGNV